LNKIDGLQIDRYPEDDFEKYTWAKAQISRYLVLMLILMIGEAES
jgi:hypothetical protein